MFEFPDNYDLHAYISSYEGTGKYPDEALLADLFTFVRNLNPTLNIMIWEKYINPIYDTKNKGSCLNFYVKLVQEYNKRVFNRLNLNKEKS